MILPLLRLDFGASPHDALRAVMPCPHVVGRGVTWWGESSPQKSSCDSSSEEGSASCRHEKRQEELSRARRGRGRDSLEFPWFFRFPR